MNDFCWEDNIDDTPISITDNIYSDNFDFSIGDLDLLQITSTELEYTENRSTSNSLKISSNKDVAEALAEADLQHYDNAVTATIPSSSTMSAQSVLQWIESLAAATEQKDREGPLLVGNIRLSEVSICNDHLMTMNASPQLVAPDVTQSQTLHPSAQVEQPAPILSPASKKELIKSMTCWLRENWTNPYIDDNGTAEMANTFGTTPSVISNWLVNARSRKWRPALVKALGLNRPADMLLEDSLNIFDGKAVRVLPPEDCAFSHDFIKTLQTAPSPSRIMPLNMHGHLHQRLLPQNRLKHKLEWEDYPQGRNKLFRTSY